MRVTFKDEMDGDDVIKNVEKITCKVNKSPNTISGKFKLGKVSLKYRCPTIIIEEEEK